jgi:hypothetical protein
MDGLWLLSGSWEEGAEQVGVMSLAFTWQGCPAWGHSLMEGLLVHSSFLYMTVCF